MNARWKHSDTGATGGEFVKQTSMNYGKNDATLRAILEGNGIPAQAPAEILETANRASEAEARGNNPRRATEWIRLLVPHAPENGMKTCKKFVFNTYPMRLKQ